MSTLQRFHFETANLEQLIAAGGGPIVLMSMTTATVELQARMCLNWGFVVLPRLVSIQIFEIHSC
jgi:hypothetical protein